MPRTPVVHYVRVSTREQAQKRFSVAGQLHALREFSRREGFEVVEECLDEGYSRDNLLRPGLMRVRELAVRHAEAGEPVTVWAWKRDRYGEAPYPEILSLELEPHGVRLRALDDSGEGDDAELLNAVKDTMARKERRDIVRRSRMGKYQLAREGKVLAAGKPPYGYRFEGGALREVPEELAILRRMFSWAAEGLGPTAIRARLREAGVPSPSGKPAWQAKSVKYVLLSDVYRGFGPEELSALLPPEAVARLDPAGTHGIKWAGKSYHRRWQEGDRYKHSVRPADRDEWIGVPVARSPKAEAMLPRGLVEDARRRLLSKRAPERRHKAREWELSGFLRCSCGQRMGGIRRGEGKPSGKLYLYYRCYGRAGGSADCRQPNLRAEEVEGDVWGAVSAVLTDPDALRRMREKARAASAAGAERGAASEAEALRKILADVRAQRERYHRMAAENLIDFGELKARLEELEGRRADANGRLDEIRRGAAEAEREARELEEALGKLALLKKEDLAGYSAATRRELYAAVDLEALACGKTVWVSGLFLHEGKFTSEHFAAKDEVRLTSENYT